VDNHRSRPVGNHSALARGVLTSCLKSDHWFAAIGFAYISSVSKQLHAVALLEITLIDRLPTLCRKNPLSDNNIHIPFNNLARYTGPMH
jgi:hypothetical protein